MSQFNEILVLLDKKSGKVTNNDLFFCASFIKNILIISINNRLY
jgi:hypothetical protein